MSELSNRLAMGVGDIYAAKQVTDTASYVVGSSWATTFTTSPIQKTPGAAVLVHFDFMASVNGVNSGWNGVYTALEYSVDSGANWVRVGGSNANTGFVTGMNFSGLGRQCDRPGAFDILIEDDNLAYSSTYMLRVLHRTFSVAATIWNCSFVLEDVFTYPTGMRPLKGSVRTPGNVINVTSQNIAAVGGATRQFTNIPILLGSTILVEFYVPHYGARNYSGSNGVTSYYEYSLDNGATWVSLGNSSASNFRIMFYNSYRGIFVIPNVNSTQIMFRVVASFITSFHSIGSGDTSGMDVHIVVKEFRPKETSGGALVNANSKRGSAFRENVIDSTAGVTCSATEAVVYTSPTIEKMLGSGIAARFYIPMRNDYGGANYGGALLRFEYSLDNGVSWTQCGYSDSYTPATMAGKAEICHFNTEVYLPNVNATSIKFRIKARHWTDGVLYLYANCDITGSVYGISIKTYEVSNT